jgi:hypothetical protein
MKKSLVSLGAAALGVLLLTGTTVRAQQIQWSFAATPIADPTQIGSPVFPGGKLPSSSPVTYIQYNPSSANVNGNSGIIVYNMTTFSQDTSLNPANFHGPDGTGTDFLASFTVQDTKGLGTPTGSALVTFHGKFDASNVTANSLSKPTITWLPVAGNVGLDGKPASGTEAAIVLGSGADQHTYDFNISGFVSSQAPSNGTVGGDGSFAVDAQVFDGNVLGSGETPPVAPEPTSLLLAGFGLPLVVLVRRRMNKGQA